MKNIPLLIASACIILFTACKGKQDHISAEESDILLTATDFNKMFDYDFPVSKTYETVSKSDILGDVEYSYEYAMPDSVQSTLYISTNVDFEGKASDAILSFNAYKLGSKISDATNEAKLVAKDSLFSYGDESSLIEIQNKDGEPIGNILAVRMGKVVYYTVFSGLYIEDNATWKALMEPKLEKAKNYKPFIHF